MTGQRSPETGAIEFEGESGTHRFDVEIVDDPFEITRGLMCRSSMKPNWGMVFLLSRTRRQSFWMSNTLIPLDMIFLDEAWVVVGVSAGAEPMTLTGRSVNKPSRYVVELTSGSAARTGIGPGTRARFFPPSR